MNFAVCFDFPEADAPVFGWHVAPGHSGWTVSLKDAALFDTEQDAQQFLDQAYRLSAREYGAVVEVGQ